MIGAILFLNTRGDVVVSRAFRSGYSIKTLAECFRNRVVSGLEADRSPINVIDGICYVHMKLTDLYLVMASRENVDCLVCFQYGVRLLQLITAYFERIDEEALKGNFAALLELIDESVDFGYPQCTDVEALRTFIPKDGIVGGVVKNTKEAERAAGKITSAIPWRAEGLIYRVNEVFVDVIESVNLLMSPSGEILQSDVVGRVAVKNFLSGMPQCELILNTRPFGDAFDSSTSAAATSDHAEVSLANVSFHPCVRLNRFDAEQNIRFVPPDGDFTLMKYTSSVEVRPPLHVVSARVKEVSKTRTEMEFCLKSELPEQQAATSIVVRIPCPDSTAHAQIKVGRGKARYRAVEHGIVWKIGQLKGGEEVAFSAEVLQISPTVENGETLWSRPPIQIAFQCVSLSLTGLRILELKVEEDEFMYSPSKWIRYTTEGGQYQCRI